MPVPTACEYGSWRCKNSVQKAGGLREKCSLCRLAPGNEDRTTHHWVPIEKLLDPHPVLRDEKTFQRIKKAKDAQKTRLAKDRSKVKVLKRAVRSEAAVGKAALEATKNSGRSNMDGDWKAGGFVTLDNKDQSNRDHPVVNMAELHKVRQDAVRAGNSIGGLVLRNKHGVGVVVFDETDFFRILGHVVETP
jgi:hypothetical protein